MKSLLTVILALCLFIPSLNARTFEKIYVIDVEGVINSVLASFLIDTIDTVDKKGDGIIIIKIDTPGGLLEATRDIVLKIMNTSSPLIGYVSPEGARAASAGAFIMLACDVLAMSPTSHIGAAHPVNLGQKIDREMEKKIVNDTVAFIIGIARKRGKNPDLARLMVTKSVSITAWEARQKNIADLLAVDLKELKKQLENYKIKRDTGDILLQLQKAQFEERQMNILEKFLFSISHPNIAYILLILGIYGIMAEFSSPGIGFPGVVGSICLILAFFALNTLPINLAGLILIFLSIVLFILELKIASGGILGIGAAVSFVLGSVMLLRTSAKFLQISPVVLISAAVFTIGFFLLLAYFGVKVQFAKVQTGQEGIIGETGYARSDLDPRGEVFVAGERWQAIGLNNQKIKKGSRIKVIDIKHLQLIVKQE